MAFSTLKPGHVLLGFQTNIVKYERDDNDIVSLRVKDNDHLWAGANPEPTGAANDLDSARGAKSSKRRAGTRARYARFTGEFTITGNDGVTVTVAVEKSVPVLTKAAYGVAPFVKNATVEGQAVMLRTLLPSGDQGLTLFPVTFKCAGLTPEQNV
jgi:hypothetical protein